jgi:hypothetical protein
MPKEWSFASRRNVTVNNRCKARTKTNEPCKARAVKKGLCAFHADPTRAAKLGRIGGKKNRRFRLPSEQPTNPPKSVKELKELLSTAICQIHTGQLDPRIGTGLATVGNVLLKAIESTDLEERIQALERSSETAKDTSASPRFGHPLDPTLIAASFRLSGTSGTFSNG